MVFGPKVASSSYDSHPRLLFRIAGCDHKGRQRQPKIVIVMHPWLQICLAGCNHKGRQKQPQISILMHSRLQIRLASCDHKGPQQQLQFASRPLIHIAGCDREGRQKQLFNARADSWPSPERDGAGGVGGVSVRSGGRGLIAPNSSPLIPHALLQCLSHSVRRICRPIGPV